MSVRNDGIDLALGAQAQVQGQVADRPLILHVERQDVGRRLAAGAEVVDFVVAVRCPDRSGPSPSW